MAYRRRHPQTVEHADSHHPGGFAADGSLLEACPGRPQALDARGVRPVRPLAESAGANPRGAARGRPFQAAGRLGGRQNPDGTHLRLAVAFPRPIPSIGEVAARRPLGHHPLGP